MDPEYAGIMTLLFLGLICFTIDWEGVEKHTGYNLAPAQWFRDYREYKNKLNAVVPEEKMPSSLIGEIYDKYGEEAVDAAVKSWEENKTKDERKELKALHSIMMAKAAKTYSENVEKQAIELGLEEDPEVKAMIQETEELAKILNSNKVESTEVKVDDFANNFLSNISQKPILQVPNI